MTVKHDTLLRYCGAEIWECKPLEGKFPDNQPQKASILHQCSEEVKKTNQSKSKLDEMGTQTKVNKTPFLWFLFPAKWKQREKRSIHFCANCIFYSRGHNHQKLKCHITIHISALSTEKTKTPLKLVRERQAILNGFFNCNQWSTIN